MDKVGSLLRSGFLEELVHELELALAPAAAIGHAHPAFLLQEVEEDDAPEQLLHVVAHALLVAVESAHDGFVGRMLGAFLPLIGLLDVALAGGVEHKAGVVLAVLVEELLRECLHGEGLADVGDGHLLALLVEQFLEVLRGRAAGVSAPEEEGEAFGVGGLLTLRTLVAEGEAPFAASGMGLVVVEDHKGGGVMVHDASSEALQVDAVVRHSHAAVDGDVVNPQPRPAYEDFPDQLHTADAGVMGQLDVVFFVGQVVLIDGV